MPELSAVIAGVTTSLATQRQSGFLFANPSATNGLSRAVLPLTLTADTTFYLDAARPDDSGDGLTAGTAFKTFAYAEKYLAAINHGGYQKILQLLSNLTQSSAFIIDQDNLTLRGDTATPTNRLMTANSYSGILINPSCRRVVVEGVHVRAQGECVTSFGDRPIVRNVRLGIASNPSSFTVAMSFQERNSVVTNNVAIESNFSLICRSWASGRLDLSAAVFEAIGSRTFIAFAEVLGGGTIVGSLGLGTTITFSGSFSGARTAASLGGGTFYVVGGSQAMFPGTINGGGTFIS